MVTFSKMKSHYKTQYRLDTDLFTKDSRPPPLQELYEQARDEHQPTVSSPTAVKITEANVIEPHS